MTTTGAISRDRDVMKVSGDEAATYLQGQISQDVDGLDVGDAAWSLVLAPSGKVDVWLRLHRLDSNEFVIDVDAGHGEAARARLERFKLRTAVEFEARPGWSMVSVRGPDAARHPVEAELSAVVTWPGFEGVDHIGLGVTPPAGVPLFDPGEFEALRIAAGWPRMGYELTPDTIPGEAGGELMARSVSFTKGCYTGQELVARIDSRGGNVPRPVRVLTGPAGSGFRAGAPVHLDGAPVGVVTSAADPRPGEPALALATVVRRVEAGSEVTVDGVPATVRPVPS